MQQIGIQPFAERLCLRVLLLDLLITDDSAFFRIHQENLAWMQPLLSENMRFIQIQDTDLGGKDQPSVIHQIVT